MNEDVKDYMLNQTLMEIESLKSIIPKDKLDKICEQFESEYSNVENIYSFLENYPIGLYKDYYLFLNIVKGRITLNDWLNYGKEGENKYLDEKYSFLSINDKHISDKQIENMELSKHFSSGLVLEDDEEADEENDSEEESTSDNSLVTDDFDISKYATLSKNKSDNIKDKKEEVLTDISNNKKEKNDDTSKDVESKEKSEENSSEKETDNLIPKEDNIFAGLEEESISEEDIKKQENIYSNPNQKSEFKIFESIINNEDINNMSDEQVLMLLKTSKIGLPDDLNKLSDIHKKLLLAKGIITYDDLKKNAEKYGEKNEEKPFDALISKAENEVKKESSSVEKSEKHAKLYIDDATNQTAEHIMKAFDKAGLLNLIPD